MNNFKEIERKFLVRKKYLPDKFDEIKEIKQGYIFNDKNGILRIRQVDNKYILTIKLKTNNIQERIEIEKELTKEEFKVLWESIPDENKIIKTRKIIKNLDGTKWEIDFFHNLDGKFKNLILAEIELKNIKQKFKKPKWLYKEVTTNPEYYNNNLIKYTKKEYKNNEIINNMEYN